jgi:glycosyltransferase involved in cell wall biosynthesis
VRRLWTADASLRGPADARNLGVADARYDVIAFTDDDARCTEDWLAVGVSALRGDQTLAGVEGAVRIDLAQRIDPVRSRIVMNLRGGGFLTASLFLRADAIATVGGFRRLRTDGIDAWAIPYREDSDLGLRVIREVGPIRFVPGAYVLHPAELVSLRRLVRVANYYVVDGAFGKLHRGVVPSVWSRPLARLRIRLATMISLLAPGVLHRRARKPVALSIFVLTLAISLQVEVELRDAGIRRGHAAKLVDSLRRLPRSLIWALAAGTARLRGEAMVRLHLVSIPDAEPADGRTSR